MPFMEKAALINDLITFLKTDSACKETLFCLSPKAEIEIRIARESHVRVTHDKVNVIAEEKPARAPEFIFDASPEAIAVLVAEKNLSPAKLGIKLLKQIVNRDIKVSMPGSILQVTSKGYFKILKVGGTEFLSELKKYNLTSLPKITAALKKLAKK